MVKNVQDFYFKKSELFCLMSLISLISEALMIGSYVFPFKVTLLTEIPGNNYTCLKCNLIYIVSVVLFTVYCLNFVYYMVKKLFHENSHHV